jgi:hypothetical protein
MPKSLEIELEANVKKVELVTKLDKSVVIRRMRMRLEREFDPLLARAIGGDSLDVLEALKHGGLEKGVIPIDQVLARIALQIQSGKAKDEVIIAQATGRKATATAPKEGEDEDLAPSIMLEFEFPFSEPAWAWFGRNTGGFANIEFSAAQLKLAKAS